MYRTFILFLLALLSLSAPAWATIIYVSGDQTGTWSADTVIVTAEVRVPPGQSLTILPGVEVLFSVYCKLIVDRSAILRAVGTAADSIRFDALQDTAHWHGIRFLSASDSSRLEYCHLTHGNATGGGVDNYGGAIHCSSSSPSIHGNTISGNGTGLPGSGGAIYCINNSDPVISDNTIGGNGAGWGGGIGCDANSNPNIIGNTISGNLGGGIGCGANSNPNIIGNTINGNSAWVVGGGIDCWDSSPAISGNTISGNTATSGGGISCLSSNPNISGNTISGNHASYGGGICCENNSSPSIHGNTIRLNEATQVSAGGGIYCSNSSPSINGNTISGNHASPRVGGGCGGIQCSGGSPTISYNTISGNTCGGVSGCGGISCGGDSIIIIGNTISGNHGVYGGGIYCSGNPIIIGNTISGNLGCGIYGWGNPTLVNCILWDNSPNQILGSPIVTYSDIQGGYTGTGNINAWPAFVDTAQHDYRLQWGSPCIDTGDPNPIYNDPDGSRADMGAWYYDQSMPVRILLTPYNAPIQIPPEGGSFQYAIQVTNIASSTLLFPLWCDITLPTGSITTPVLGPVRISLGTGQTVSRVRTQSISAHAPAGLYHYNAYAVATGDTSEDNFVFTKLGSGNRNSGFGGWTNTGEEFVGEMPSVASIHPSSFILHPCAPNPFNPTTAISFNLPQAGWVKLEVFDIAGRNVGAHCMRPEGLGTRSVPLQAGTHQITFDGSALPSGIYFAKLEAGDYSHVQKLILLK